MLNERINELVFRVSDEFNGILRANLYEIGLNDDEMIKLKRRKREMRTALKNCGIGDLDAKNYIKSCIKDNGKTIDYNEISENLKDGNVVTGVQVKKVYKDNESDIGIKNEPVTFQVIKNNSTVSFSKGQTSTLDAIIKDEDCYKYEEVKYPSGKLRIIKFVEVR